MIPDVSSPGLLVMVHELPDARGTQVTALNFGSTPIEETIVLPNVQSGLVVDMINETVEGDLSETGELVVRRRAHRAAGSPLPAASETS